MGLSERATIALASHQEDATDRIERILRVRRGALLADEPGLGKTWVAATIAARRTACAERCEVFVPAHLRGYWRDALAMFGADAVVMSHESLASCGSRLECEGPQFIVVDEAHRFRNPRTKRYEGLARRSIHARVLLVTATPLCNSPSDLRSLLDLIVADDELADAGIPSVAECFLSEGAAIATLLRELVVRHSTEEVEIATTSRVNVDIEYVVAENCDALRDQIHGLMFPWTNERVPRDLLCAFLERRLESSVAALAATIRRMLRVCHRAQHLAARGVTLTATALRRVLGDPDGGTFQDIFFPELWGARVDGRQPPEADFDREAARLSAIVQTLGPDPKEELLMELVRQRREIPGIVFTVSFDTASSLYSTMSQQTRCALLTGRRCLLGGVRKRIDDIVAAVNAGLIDLVIATDLGGEGLNLQAAGYVVHYDQPWNPAVLDQRIGRICRIGQARRSVETIRMVPPGGRSAAIVSRKRERNERFWLAGANLDRGANPTRQDVWRPPARLDRTCSQVMLVRQLRASGLSTGELIELLSKRVRVGVERALDRIAREPLDRRSVERLVRLLTVEREMIRR